jgi:16S rRNA (cytosine1402-N4)-methyltransferase
MEFNHKPVLLEECITNLEIKNNGIYADCTLGGAGHASEILKRLSEKGTFIGLDQDEVAFETASKRLEEINKGSTLILENINFKNLDDVCKKYGIEGIDGILMDLGVSSYQLDEGERGFSYQKDAELDMRMDRKNPLTASTVINNYDEKEIIRVIRDYGEENWAVRIAQFIVNARKESKIETTHQLVDIIKKAIPAKARQDGPHPAKRTFQAIRIEVNNELGILENAVKNAARLLKNHGRLCIITFHSLEDRIVKNAFQDLVKPCKCPSDFPICVCNLKSMGKLITKKPLISGNIELEENPRSRSAKLRVFEKNWT